MDPSSGRVVDFRLSALWRDKVGVAGFTDALASAVTKARLSYLEAVTTKPGDRDQSTPSVLSAEDWERLPLGQQLAALGRLTDLLDAVTTEAAHVLQCGQPNPTVDYAGSDPRHVVRITLNVSGALVRLTIAEDWLAGASTARVVQAVKDAFESAYASLDSAHEPALATATPAADRVLALASNPQVLRGWLRQEEH
ncbi:hypothetical protein [Thermasporomyces composti]|jgi:hypothetical protein|nr:hypothetical protein [Thermasporomyces composti]